MSNNILKQDYYDELYSIIRHEPDKFNTYFILLGILRDIPFRFRNNKDKNRMEDIYEWREKYHPDEKDKHLIRLEPISVFEMLVLMATIMSEILDDGDSKVATYFWELIDNLGFTECTDEHYGEEIDIGYGDAKIKNVIFTKVNLETTINTLLRGDYKYPNYDGSMFPLSKYSVKWIKNNPNIDLDYSKLDLYTQMNVYLNNRYYVDDKGHLRKEKKNGKRF